MKNNTFNLTLLGCALVFYVLYKVSGKTPLAFISFLFVLAAGIHRLIFDIKHGTLPFTKARQARRELWEKAMNKDKNKDE